MQGSDDVKSLYEMLYVDLYCWGAMQGSDDDYSLYEMLNVYIYTAQG